MEAINSQALSIAKMPFFNLHDFVSLLTAAICVLLVIYQAFLPRAKSLSNVLLSLFFLSIGVAAVSNVLLWNAYISLNSHWLKVIIPYVFSVVTIAKGIFLYFYIACLTQQDFKFRYPQLLAFLPLLLVLVLVTVFHLDADALRFISASHSATEIEHAVWVWHVLRVVPLVYAVSAVMLTIYYHNNLKEYYSSYVLKGPLWLSILTLGFAFNWAWALVTHLSGKYLFGGNLPISISDTLGITNNYITFVLLNALFIYSFVYSNKLMVIKSESKHEVSSTLLSETELIKIRNGMEVDHLYLKNNLNIEDFSRSIGLPYREVSSMINKHFNTNFYEFVNLYRVNKAKALLSDPGYADKTILEILLEAGFNSKSAFHRFFKRYTGMSASDYRKSREG